MVITKLTFIFYLELMTPVYKNLISKKVNFALPIQGKHSRKRSIIS